MKVFYVYRTARKKLLKEFLRETNHSTFLYGLPELETLGFNCTFSDFAYHKFNILNYALKAIEQLHQYLLNYSIGFKLHQALLLWPQYKNSDVIITTQDSAGLPFLFLKRIGIVKPKIIYISNSLANSLSGVRNKKVLAFVKRNLQAADSLVCYSKKEKVILGSFVEKPVTFIPLGVDVNFFKPKMGETKKTYDILAAGKDSFRDYKTLFDAVRNTAWKVIVACSPANVSDLDIPSNVIMLYNVSAKKMRQLYQTTRLIVIPMKKTHKTQGQVVFLEAAAMGKPIIASRVSGLTAAYDLARCKNITLVTPEKSAKLKTAIRKAFQKKPTLKTDRKYRASISMQTYAKNLAKIIYNVNHD